MIELEIKKNPIDFDLIQFRKHTPKRLTRNIERKIFGLDTETLNGSCKLLADSKGNYVLSESLDYECQKDLDVFLDFLTSHRFRSSHNFFFNLNYDVNAIIKYFDKELLQSLYEDLKIQYNNYTIFFIPKKVFRISKNKHVYKFYDIAQFYKTSLEKASRKYLGLEKYIEIIDREKLGTDKNYWKKRMYSIIRYCINDSKLTSQLGELLNTTLKNAVGLNPCTYMSKASICKEFVRKTVDIPDINKIPRNALKYAFYTYSGGRFEVFKKGFIGNGTLYDINSAYPFTLHNLLDVNKGKWKRVTSLHENADYGFYLVKVFVKYNRISPIGITLKNGIKVYPIIQFATYLTKKELLEYEKYLDYDIIDGWEFYADEIVYPFRDYISKLFELKSKTPKEDYKYDMYKINMNSLSGCFYEKSIRKEPDNNINSEVLKDLLDKSTKISIMSGKLFNPVYATLITADTRINLFKTSIPHFDKTVAYATDSILFEGFVDIPTSKKLGGWGIHTKNKPTIVLKGGIYKIGNELKNRGIKKAKFINTPNGKFDNLFDYIESCPNQLQYPITMNRPLTFIEVLLHHLKHNISDINRFTEMSYNIDLNRDYKRIWDDTFKCGKELFEKSIDSQPLIIA